MAEICNLKSAIFSLAPVWVLAAMTACAPRAVQPPAPKAAARIVCLGDSITDGCTYPQIIGQALREARRLGTHSQRNVSPALLLHRNNLNDNQTP